MEREGCWIDSYLKVRGWNREDVGRGYLDVRVHHDVPYPREELND